MSFPPLTVQLHPLNPSNLPRKQSCTNAIQLGREKSRSAEQMRTTGEQRSDRNRSRVCFFNRAVNQAPTSLTSSILLREALPLVRGRAEPERSDETWISSEGFSRLCVMSEAEHPPITPGVIIIPQGFKERGGERRRKWRKRKKGGVGCYAIGTGSLSGNPSTCHHNCMLLKRVQAQVS